MNSKLLLAVIAGISMSTKFVSAEDTTKATTTDDSAAVMGNCHHGCDAKGCGGKGKGKDMKKGMKMMDSEMTHAQCEEAHGKWTAKKAEADKK